MSLLGKSGTMVRLSPTRAARSGQKPFGIRAALAVAAAAGVAIVASAVRDLGEDRRGDRGHGRGQDSVGRWLDHGARDFTGPDGPRGSVVTHHSATRIRRPVDVVAAYVFDPRTMPHWSAVLYEIEPVIDIEPRLGRTLRANLKVLGVTVIVNGELVEVDLEKRQATVQVVPTSGGGRIEHRLWVERARRGSVLHFWNQIEVPRWLSSTISEPVIRRFLDHTATFALANIKDILENEQEDNIRQLPVAAHQEMAVPIPPPG